MAKAIIFEGGNKLISIPSTKILRGMSFSISDETSSCFYDDNNIVSALPKPKS